MSDLILNKGAPKLPVNHCTPYPSNLSSLEDCCKPPILFDDDVAGTCEFMCSENTKTADNPDCPVKCLLENNGIVNNKKVNNTALEWTYNKFGLGSPLWINITKEGLEQCVLEYPDTKRKESFDQFEKCMHKRFVDNCVEFKDPVECDAVEDFMVDCQDIHPDCKTWPVWIVKLPEYCCPNRPKLFTKEQLVNATDYCSDQDIISTAGSMQCIATYLLNATGIKVNGKWNFAVALKMLNDHNSDAKWKSSIEKTMQTCEKQVHGETEKFSRACLELLIFR